MKAKLYDIILKNLGWKLLALVAAIVFWVAYINLQDPVDTETITGVAVQVLNYDGYVEDGGSLKFADPTLNIENLTVNVTVQARKSVIKSLRKKRDALYVYVDLYEIKKDDNRLLIHYEISPNYRYAFNTVKFVNVSNVSYYEIVTESTESKMIPLDYTIIGTPAEGYIYKEEDAAIQLTPGEIYISGLESKIADVARASITVSVEGAKANLAPSAPISYYDQEGNQIYFQEGEVTTSVNAASLFIPIYKTKEVKVKAALKEAVPEGYAYMKDLELSESVIQVYGPESELAHIHEIQLPDVDLSQCKESWDTTYTMSEVLNTLYPNGEVRMLDDSVKIRETFTVEKLYDKDVEIPTSEIQIISSGGREVQFEQDTILFKIQGTKKAIDALDETQLTLRASIKDLADGEQILSVSVIELPEGLSAPEKTVELPVVITAVAEEEE